MEGEKIQEAVAAAVAVTNDWLASDESLPNQLHDYSVELVTPTAARYLRAQFSVEEVDRLVGWDWEKLFQKKVKFKQRSWMFSIVSSKRVGAVCYGQAKFMIDASYISIEYLERMPSGEALKGYTVLIALHFTQTLASTLGLRELRIANPLPELVEFYQEYYYFLPHFDPSGAVDYMYKGVEDV